MPVVIALCYIVAIVLLVVAAFILNPPARPRLVVLAGAFALTAFALPAIAAAF